MKARHKNQVLGFSGQMVWPRHQHPQSPDPKFHIPDLDLQTQSPASALHHMPIAIHSPYRLQQDPRPSQMLDHHTPEPRFQPPTTRAQIPDSRSQKPDPTPQALDSRFLDPDLSPDPRCLCLIMFWYYPSTTTFAHFFVLLYELPIRHRRWPVLAGLAAPVTVQ